MIFISCTDTYINHIESPVPVNIDYYGVMEVHKTGAVLVKTENTENDVLKRETIKSFFSQKHYNFKSFYVKADADGTIEVEYKLEEEIPVEPGYDGTVFGILQITNESHNEILHVPVGYLP